MSTNRTKLTMTLTPFEARILDLAFDEAGVDLEDEAGMGEALAEIARRVRAQRERRAASKSWQPPTVQECFDQLVLVCMNEGLSRPDDEPSYPRLLERA